MPICVPIYSQKIDGRGLRASFTRCWRSRGGMRLRLGNMVLNALLVVTGTLVVLGLVWTSRSGGLRCRSLGAGQLELTVTSPA